VLSSPVDGVFTYVYTEKLVEWQRPGELIGVYAPHEGMGSRLLQVAPALLPQTYAFRLTADPTLRVWLSFMIQTGLLAATALAYYRAAGVPLGLAVVATWIYVVLALTMSDLARSSWNAVSAQAGMLVALVLFIQIGRGPRRRNAIGLIGFVLFSVILLLSDHLTVGYLAGPPFALAFVAHLLATPCWSERGWKIGALAAAVVAVVVLGIPQWAQALTASVARTVFNDELIAQPQHALNSGVIFRTPDGYAIVHALVIVGVLGELAVGDRRRRTLAAFTGLISAGLVVAGLVDRPAEFRP